MTNSNNSEQQSTQVSTEDAKGQRRPLGKRLSRWVVIRRIRFRRAGRWLKVFYSKVKEVSQSQHRFVVMDSQTFKEKLAFQLSGLNLFIAIGILSIVLIVLNTILIAFTPLREYIPGYANGEMVEQTYHNAALIDSLEQRLAAQEWMIATIQDVVNEKDMVSVEEAHQQADSLAAAGFTVGEYRHSEADSLLRLYVEQNDSRYQVHDVVQGTADQRKATAPVAATANLYFTPVKGQVIDTFDTRRRHYGVDVTGISNAPVNAVASGTVLFSDFTPETGYVIVLQHHGNVVSVYKHCSSLLKQEGDVVLVGEPLGYIGNAHQYPSGPLLHFELWMAGKPVDPAQFVLF